MAPYNFTFYINTHLHSWYLTKGALLANTLGVIKKQKGFTFCMYIQNQFRNT